MLDLEDEIQIMTRGLATALDTICLYEPEITREYLKKIDDMTEEIHQIEKEW